MRVGLCLAQDYEGDEGEPVECPDEEAGELDERDNVSRHHEHQCQ